MKCLLLCVAALLGCTSALVCTKYSALLFGNLTRAKDDDFIASYDGVERTEDCEGTEQCFATAVLHSYYTDSEPFGTVTSGCYMGETWVSRGEGACMKDNRDSGAYNSETYGCFCKGSQCFTKGKIVKLMREGFGTRVDPYILR